MTDSPATGAVSAADAELLALMRRGEPGAFVTIMQQNNRRLYRLARSIVKDESEAEEIVQEGYLRALTHLDGFKGEASLATWLARIVANEALGRLRRRRPTVDIADIAETLTNDAPDAPPSPEQAAARHEIRRLLERAVDELPPLFRAVFVLRAIEQMSIEETAQCLGILPDTVKTRFHRANRLLRSALSAELSTLFDGAFPFAGARCERLMGRVIARLGLNQSTAPHSDRPAPEGGSATTPPIAPR